MLERQIPPIPTVLRAFLEHCRMTGVGSPVVALSIPINFVILHTEDDGTCKRLFLGSVQIVHTSCR